MNVGQPRQAWLAFDGGGGNSKSRDEVSNNEIFSFARLKKRLQTSYVFSKFPYTNDFLLCPNVVHQVATPQARWEVRARVPRATARTVQNGLMPLAIQTAGTKTPRRPFIRGPDPPANAVVLNAKALPNPHGRLKDYTSRRHLDNVKDYLLDNDATKVRNLVTKGCDAIRAGRPLVIVCLFGQDRSRAIAELIGDHFHPSEVHYVHREA